MRDRYDLIRQLIREIYHETAEVTVYHSSPQLSLRRINPRYSPKFHEDGIFVSNSMESMWNSWIAWAMRKPDKTGSGRTSDTFQNVAVYTIKIPKKVFDEAKKHHSDTAAAASDGDVGTWGWDVETFIPERLLPDGHLVPSSVKVYTRQEVEKMTGGRESWPSAGKRPRDEFVPRAGKNPAREMYDELQREVPLAALRRGGPIGQPSDWRSDVPGGPQAELKVAMAKLAGLARKTRLTTVELAEAEALVEEIEELMAVPAADVAGPDNYAPAKTEKLRGSKPKTLRPMRRGGY